MSADPEDVIDDLENVLVEYDERGDLFGTSGAGAYFLAAFLVKRGYGPVVAACRCCGHARHDQDGAPNMCAYHPVGYAHCGCTFVDRPEKQWMDANRFCGNGEPHARPHRWIISPGCVGWCT